MTSTPSTTNPLAKIRPGDTFSTVQSGWYNSTIDLINRFQQQQLNQGVNKKPSFPYLNYYVGSIFDDYILCKLVGDYGPTTGTIAVAKPFLLRRSPFDGHTIHGLTYAYSDSLTRTVTRVSDSLQELQIVAPTWLLPDGSATPTAYLGDIIQAAPGPTGLVDANNIPIGWTEILGDGGRVWSVVPTT